MLRVRYSQTSTVLNTIRRAIYQAEHLGLDVENIQAYNAEDPKSRRAYLTTIREYFARVKMFMDLITYNDKTERK